MRPLMVTFGAGAWAYAIGAAMARMAKAIIRTAKVVLFIRLSSIRLMTFVLGCLCLLNACNVRNDGTTGEASLFGCHPPQGKRIGKCSTVLPRTQFMGQEKSRKVDTPRVLIKTATYLLSPIAFSTSAARFPSTDPGSRSRAARKCIR